MIFRKLAGRWKTERVGAGERGREGGLIWAVTVTMMNGRWRSVLEIRKNTCPAVPERRATQTRCGSRKRSGMPAQDGGVVGADHCYCPLSLWLWSCKATNTWKSFLFLRANEEQAFLQDSCCNNKSQNTINLDGGGGGDSCLSPHSLQ